MDRRPFELRSVPLHLAVLIAVAVCALLGAWQLDRAQAQHAQSIAAAQNVERAPAPLASVLTVDGRLRVDDVARPVVATGTYDPAAQLVVPDREVSGRSGSLVLTPLVLPDGSAVVVVRGLWTGGAVDPPAPPPGQITVTGWLGPTEAAPEPGLMTAGQVGTVHLPTLVNLMPYDLLDGFLARTGDRPPDPGAASMLAWPAPTSVGDGTWPWRNVFYAIEWWVFGLAAVAFWISVVRRRDPAEPLTGAPTARRAVAGDEVAPPADPGRVADPTGTDRGSQLSDVSRGPAR